MRNGVCFADTAVIYTDPNIKYFIMHDAKYR